MELIVLEFLKRKKKTHTISAMRDVVFPGHVNIFVLAPRDIIQGERRIIVLIQIPMPIRLAQEFVHELLVKTVGVHPGVRHDIEAAPRSRGVLGRVAAGVVGDLLGVVGREPGAGHEDEERKEEHGGRGGGQGKQAAGGGCCCPEVAVQAR